MAEASLALEARARHWIIDAGIGAAVVRRVLEEGAKAVVFSDTHARRLAEAESALAEEFGAGRVRQTVCDVTDDAQVGALLDLADEVGGVDLLPHLRGQVSRALRHVGVGQQQQPHPQAGPD